VAFFHLALFTPTNYTFEVSIAQARCGLLPLTGGHLLAQVSWLFQSLKRDVAFFHAQEQPCCRETHAGFNRSSAMWPSSTGSYAIPYGGSAMFQSLKRDVAFFHLVFLFMVFPPGRAFQSLKRDVAFFHTI